MNAAMVSPSSHALVEQADYWRLRGADDLQVPYKEWQHFVVFGQGWTLAFNLNLDGAAAARVISILVHDGWHGHVATCASAKVRPSGMNADFGFAGVRWSAGRYTIWQRGEGPRFEIQLEPVSTPSLSHNIGLGAGAALSWCLVPRLTASGWMEHGGKRFVFGGCPAYHDHNWGHFAWGGDFSWEWGCGISERPDGKWTVVFGRTTDRARHRTSATTLFLLRDGRHLRYFRNAEVRFETRASTDTRPAGRTPAAAALVLPDMDRDVPALLRIEARRGDDFVRCEVVASTRGQVLVPADSDPRRIVRLNEADARVRVEGQCVGHRLAMEGPGLLEVVHA
jgi:hypothetical protein